MSQAGYGEVRRSRIDTTSSIRGGGSTGAASIRQAAAARSRRHKTLQMSLLQASRYEVWRCREKVASLRCQCVAWSQQAYRSNSSGALCVYVFAVRYRVITCVSRPPLLQRAVNVALYASGHAPAVRRYVCRTQYGMAQHDTPPAYMRGSQPARRLQKAFTENSLKSFSVAACAAVAR